MYIYICINYCIYYNPVCISFMKIFFYKMVYDIWEMQREMRMQFFVNHRGDRALHPLPLLELFFISACNENVSGA